MDFLRVHQLNIMLFMSGICGVLAVLVLLTESVSRRRKGILASIEAAAMFLLLADRYAYIFRGDPSQLGYWMVRICNFLVFFLPLESFDLLSGMCDFPITAGMDPVTETGAVSHLAPRRATSIAGAGISITELCQSPELAVQAADWFYSDTATMIGNYGIEGKTYTLQDSTPEYTDLALKDLANLTASLQGVWATAREKVFQEEYLDVLAVWTRQKDTDYMLPDLHFGTKAQDAYELLMLDINSYADGCVAQLVSGDMPISEIPAIRERLKELHIDEALSIWQKALDSYK